MPRAPSSQARCVAQPRASDAALRGTRDEVSRAKSRLQELLPGELLGGGRQQARAGNEMEYFTYRHPER